jgi:hypothetical protein
MRRSADRYKFTDLKFGLNVYIPIPEERPYFLP